MRNIDIDVQENEACEWNSLHANTMSLPQEMPYVCISQIFRAYRFLLTLVPERCFIYTNSQMF